MAIYRLSLTSIKRSDGRSAVAAAAYRAGERIRDDRAAKTHDYRKKGRGVIRRKLIGWRGSRSALWNRAEEEKHPRAQVAREITIALPAELPPRWREMLAVEFGHYLRDRFGVAVDLAIHKPSARGDDRNEHAHLLFTTREVNDLGNFGRKTRELDEIQTSRPALEEMRQAWADACNAALRLYGSTARVDHRSYQRQGLDVESEHQGRGTLENEHRGEETERGEEVRERRKRNRKRRARAKTRAPIQYPAPVQGQQAIETPAPNPEQQPARRAALTEAEREEVRAKLRAARAQQPEKPAPEPPQIQPQPRAKRRRRTQ